MPKRLVYVEQAYVDYCSDYKFGVVRNNRRVVLIIFCVILFGKFTT